MPLPDEDAIKRSIEHLLSNSPNARLTAQGNLNADGGRLVDSIVALANKDILDAAGKRTNENEEGN